MKSLGVFYEGCFATIKIYFRQECAFIQLFSYRSYSHIYVVILIYMYVSSEHALFKSQFGVLAFGLCCKADDLYVIKPPYFYSTKYILLMQQNCWNAIETSSFQLNSPKVHFSKLSRMSLNILVCNNKLLLQLQSWHRMPSKLIFHTRKTYKHLQAQDA